MLSSIRLIMVISLVLILGATVFFGWYYKNSSEQIIQDQAHKSSTAIAHSYINAVWPTYEEWEFPVDGIYVFFFDYFFNSVTPADRVSKEKFINYIAANKKFIENTPIIKFNVYSPNGKLFLSVDHSSKGFSTEPKDQSLLSAHLSGLIDPLSIMTRPEGASEIIRDANFIGLDGSSKNGDVIRTLVPVREKGSKHSKGALELYFEVTDATSKTRDTQYIGMAIIIGTFVILITMLVLITRRSEKIIEKQYEMNVELTSAKSKAESENEEKSKFLASISHELRTPLNAIIGFSEIIKDEVMGELANQQYKNYVTDIHSQGVHLLSLINDILDYSKAEAGKLEMEHEEIDLHKLIANCLRTQEPRANEGNVKLLRELPSDHIIITTDPKRLKQVLLNLLSNAVKFTPEQGQVKISAWENVTDGRIGIEISDTGIGISAKNIAKALSPFGQVDSELSRRYEGTGLGLPLTKKFIELLSGSMNIDSEEGKGTKVTVFLPPSSDLTGKKDKYRDQDPVAQMKEEQRAEQENALEQTTDYANEAIGETSEEEKKMFTLDDLKKEREEDNNS